MEGHGPLTDPKGQGRLMLSHLPSSHWDLLDIGQDFCPSAAAPALPSLESMITSSQPRAGVKGFKNNLWRCCNATCEKEVGCSPNWGRKFLFQHAKCETEGKNESPCAYEVLLWEVINKLSLRVTATAQFKARFTDQGYCLV